jgi:Tol biopolymer transport system component
MVSVLSYRFTVWVIVGLISLVGMSFLILSSNQGSVAVSNLVPPTELFFSEYIEGSSNNKSLEIYNGTGVAMDLAAGSYDVQIFFNGSTTPGNTISLTGMVADGDVYVLAHSSASATILAEADQTSGSLTYNGDDAIVLRKAGVVIDSIGQVGFDPGTEWGSGLTSTADNTLRRKSSICQGDTDFTDAFDPSIEWDGFATDTFTGLGSHTATCVPPPPQCTLVPAMDTNPVGTSHTVTVTVTQNGSPVSDVSVSFNVTTGPNASATGTGTTDTNGQASFTYTSNGLVGTDTIEANGTVNGTPFSCIATKTWIVIPPLIINEVDSDTVGTDALEFVELFDGGVGNTSLDGLVVVFYNGSNDQSYAAFDLDGLSTDADGYFVLGSAAVAGVDLVFADNLLQNGADAVALYAGDAADFPTGTAVTTTNLIDALVYDTNDADDAGLLVLLNPGQPQVNEAGGGDSEADSNQRCPNGSGGERNTNTYLQAAPTPGAENLCPSDVGCTLAPASATNPVGSSHTVTVTVTQSGSPVSGVTVTFTVSSGPNSGATGSDITDANGQASFTYTSNGLAGTDTIETNGTVNSTLFSCLATKTWVAIPPLIINEVDSDTPGSDTMEFIELFGGGVGNTPLDGLVLVFYNGSNDQSYAAFDLDGFSTDANGYFVLGNAAVPGVDLVFADNTLQSGADAVALYFANAADFPNGTLVTTTNLIDALVYDTDDADDAGLLVLLNPGQSQVNEGGGGDSAAESNQRCPNGSGGARNTNTYGQGVPTPNAANTCVARGVCSLRPASATNQVGSSHTVTVTVTVRDAPVRGLRVTFRVTSGPNVGEAGLSVTDLDGQASFSYTGSGGVGVDSIQASGEVNGLPFACTATNEWLDVACALDPSTDTNPVGSSHTVTATVTSEGSRVSNVSVNFRVVAGPNAGATGSAMTNARGQARFTYSSNGMIGTDTIRASGTVRGVSFSCTATKTWVVVMPDQTKIAFTSTRDGNREIYVMNTDGSQQTRLTNHPADDFEPAWSPDGQHIAFTSQRDGNDEIYVMNADGSHPRNISNHPSSDSNPAWSPDGSMIAFTSRRDGNDEIYVMNADGSHPRRLTFNSAPGSRSRDVQPTWSPDGAMIAFTSHRDGNDEIYVMDADGSHLTRLTNHPRADDDPVYSPDGQRIAFTRRGRGIFVMDADGSNPTRLAISGAGVADPTWSPDGFKIALVNGFSSRSDIFVVNADGSNLTRLTNNRAIDADPTWQPRSTTLTP